MVRVVEIIIVDDEAIRSNLFQAMRMMEYRVYLIPCDVQHFEVAPSTRRPNNVLGVFVDFKDCIQISDIEVYRVVFLVPGEAV